MTRFRLSNEAKMDLARIYWRGVEEFGQAQADRYYEALIRRFGDIAEAPLKYQAVEHIREGYARFMKCRGASSERAAFEQFLEATAV